MNNRTLLTLRSLTSTLKAKKLLEAAGFIVKTVKITENDGVGCRYGLSVLSGDIRLATEILTKNGVFPDV